jgi:(E)-4-hydroxy-3-methylbut-2-enyl-diphosphate synthase
VLINYDNTVEKFQEPIKQNQMDIMTQNNDKDTSELKDLFTIDELIKENSCNSFKSLNKLKSINSSNYNKADFKNKAFQNIIEDIQIKSAADMGPLVFDGLCDGIFLMNQGSLAHSIVDTTAFGILQAGRIRTSKTEYISCPGCGRTLYDLEATIARIKAATSHLKGPKIGIMGCIVNGPGEMADADYGYVGAGRGKVSLYKKKECIEKNIPEEQAVDKLIELIRRNGDYVEK